MDVTIREFQETLPCLGCVHTIGTTLRTGNGCGLGHFKTDKAMLRMCVHAVGQHTAVSLAVKIRVFQQRQGNV